MAEFIGTDNDDKIIGSAEGDIVNSGKGNDVVQGDVDATPNPDVELLVDGGFEARNLRDGTWKHYESVGGWQTDTRVEIWGNRFLGHNASEGSNFAELDYNRQASNLYQDVETAEGEEYVFSFDAAMRAGTTAATNTIEIYWNGEFVGSVTPDTTDWTHYEFTVFGTGGEDRIEFREEAGDNDSYGGMLDSVSLMGPAPTPQPHSNDIIDTGAGDDYATGNRGDDFIVGGSGNDTLHGNDGNDMLFGGSSDRSGIASDKAPTKADNDFIDGGAGDDIIYGQNGHDELIGGAGNDQIWGNSGNDRIDGGADDDIIYGGKDDDTISDGIGDDTVFGDSGDDTVIAGANGDDSYTGGSGNDTLDYSQSGSGNLTIDLSKGTVKGDGQNDKINGFETFVSGQGDDTIKGSKHDESIDAGAGDDVIRGYKGADALTGGEGADRYYWERKDLDGVDTITDFDSQEDVLDFSGLVKATKYDDVSEIVRIEQSARGAEVSVYSGTALGWQTVVVLQDVETDVAQLADDGAFVL